MTLTTWGRKVSRGEGKSQVHQRPGGTEGSRHLGDILNRGGCGVTTRTTTDQETINRPERRDVDKKRRLAYSRELGSSVSYGGVRSREEGKKVREIKQ